MPRRPAGRSQKVESLRWCSRSGQNVLVLVLPAVGRLQEESWQVFDQSLSRSVSGRGHPPQPALGGRPDQAARCGPQHLLHQRPSRGLGGSSRVHRRLHPGVVRHRPDGQPAQGQLPVRDQRPHPDFAGQDRLKPCY